MSELWQMAASDLALQVRARKVSSREVIEAHLRRIERVNPRVNAITVVLEEEAHALSRGAHIYAELVAGCMTFDTDPKEGYAMERALRRVLHDADLSPSAIDLIL